MSSESLFTALCRVAHAQPDAAAVLTGERELTFHQLVEGATRLAGFLKGRGVSQGDRVLIFSESRPEYLMALFACARAGAVLATVYPSFGTDEIEYIIAHSDPAIALVEAERRAVFESVAAKTAAGLEVHDLVAAATDPAVEPLTEDPPAAPDDRVLICYTSGTSSRPKAVLHGNAGLIRASEMHIDTWAVTAADRLLVMTPMAWLFGLVTTCLTALLAGAPVVLMPHFHPVRALELIGSRRVTVLIGVGTMYAKLVEAASERGGHFPNTGLRLCVSGGEGRNEPALNAFHELSGCPVHDIYAASECFPMVTYDPRVDPEPRAAAAGRVVKGATVRIVDPDGKDVAPGEVGELIGRSAASMIGYFRQDDLTAKVVDQDGFFHTSDLARIDEDGIVHIVGRTSDMIIRGGANVSPAEVERVLAVHPAVAEVAVVGEPDPAYGQKIVAYVVRKNIGVSEEELVGHASAHLAKYKVPTRVEFVDDLPRTATGKVKRYALTGPQETS